MAYPEKLLADDEQVVEHLHPHWITLVPATLWFLILCAAAGVGAYFAPDHGTSRSVVLIAVAVVAVVLFLPGGLISLLHMGMATLGAPSERNGSAGLAATSAKAGARKMGLG